jgi:D-beta-D-heptose 7-phosphate kinase / D-beta-D-heptose 1-phosphate adenosyltransferase
MDFSALTILVVGDIMLDRFLHGDIDRISPEAPVPVIRLRQTREMLGGAGNVASNIASLGGRATLLGLVGADDSAAKLRHILETQPGITAALTETPHRPTICKTRFVAGRQQVVRADEESHDPLHPTEIAALITAFDTHLPTAQAVILSDYGKGVLHPTVVAHAIAQARAANIPVFVDPKTDDFSLYRGATCITPNAREMARAARAPVSTEAEITQAARALIASAGIAAILVTRSEKGMVLVDFETTASVPARAREVFDVSGAGDTVIATLALAFASGRTLVQSMHIANAAAGVVVSKLGTATADISEVLHELSAQDAASPTTPGLSGTPGLLTWEAATHLIHRWHDQGFSVGFTNGCFDILHPGHVSLLAFARRQCDRLIVALNTDESVARLKGPTRPVNNLAQRAAVMSAIRHVDAVVAFGEETPLELITALVPDVLVKGADYTVENIVGADIVQSAGGRVVLAELVPGQSTTGIIAKMKEG